MSLAAAPRRVEDTRSSFDVGPVFFIGAVVVLAVLVIVPLAWLFVISLQKVDVGGFTLFNYVDAFTKSIYLRPIVNSFILALSVATIAALLDSLKRGADVVLDQGRALEHRRTLDMRTGVLHRRWRQELPGGAIWDFRSARFASLDDRRLLALEAGAECDGRPVSLGGQAPVPAVEGAVEGVNAEVRGGDVAVAMRAKGGGAATYILGTREEAGHLERVVAVHPDADAVEGGPVATPVGALRARHERAWRDRWFDADVTIEGDPATQRALRFALYHLISAGDPESDRASIGARGMTGPGYRGHVFWDTEIFVLPFFIWTHPETARALLAYRHRTLPGARAKAARLGYEGALYAWESADTGEETTPEFVWLPDGTRLTILTGVQEHHIAADVAWAVWQYWRVTADARFLVDMGAEILLETARFWASRTTVGADGRHHICTVIGPDEYHEGVDDNAYTNALAAWNLRTAAGLFDLVPGVDGPAWESLLATLGIDDADRRRWLEVADGLVDGFDPATLLYQQCAGFFALDDIRAVDLAPRPFTGEMVVGVERLRRTQVVKQADVLMLPLLLPESVGPGVALANYRYYEPRTSHGSSLSPAIHALAAARLGALDDAEWYFGLAAGIDLDDRMGNAADGVHIATMGGLWQAAVMGFGGLRVDGEALRLDPCRPPSWPSFSFPVRWRGVRVRVGVGADTVTVDLDGPASIAMGTGDAVTAGPGRVVSRMTDDGWSPLGPA